jgi:nitrate/TMAO reductase-like tetraheme cytochrome c subunit
VRGGRLPKTVLTVVPVPAGALGWVVTHNVVITLGLALIVGLVVIGLVWHIVREETRQVELREKGATDRLQICHHSERVLAETHRSVYRATVCGPSASAADARAVREDARQAARELRRSTSLEEAMRITRAQGPDAAEDRDDGPGPAGPLTAA